MSHRIGFLVILLLQILQQINGEGYYSIVAPGTLRPNSEYHVAVSVHKSSVPSTLKLGIISSTYSDFKTLELPPYSSDLVTFQIPDLKSDEYNLTASGTGIDFTNSTKLNFDEQKLSVLIQTDKSIYKPGDLVRYRVLILDSQTRPAKVDGEIVVSIEDGKKNLIRQMKNVNLTKGVYSDELQLSSQPVLGDWLINVLVEGKTYEKKYEVAEYVLPKFEVIIEAPKNIAYKDNKLRATIRSKYTFGKPVKGEATVSVYPKTYGSLQPFLYDLITRKVVQLDGKARVEFDIQNELKFKEEYSREIIIEAIVEEKLTGRKQNTTTTVLFHRNPYRIIGINVPNTYTPGESLQFTAKIEDIDGVPVQDTNNPVTVQLSKSYGSEKANQTEYHLDKNGMFKGKYTFPENATEYFVIWAKYLDIEESLGTISKKVDGSANALNIEIKTENPTINNEVSVEVTSSKEMKYFVYQIIGRGDIIVSKLVEVPDNRKYHVFKFLATFAMVPKAKIFIYFVQDGDLIFDEKTIDFGEQLWNFIKLDVPVQARPGQDVDITVSTKPNSYVGLLGVDQSVLLLKSGNDLSYSQVFNELDKYSSSAPWVQGYGRNPGHDSGLVTLTNANYPFDKFIGIGGIFPVALNSPTSVFYAETAVVGPQLTARKDFPESWIWETINEIGNEGRTTIHKKVPDTITSWIITGFSLDPVTGLGLTKDPRKLQVFQPFFVSTDLPYSVKRGEVVAVPIVVFNYMDKDLNAEVTLDNTGQEFDFTESSNEVEETPKIELYRRKRLAVPSNTGQTVSFLIRPKKVGHITIKISATTPISGDAIERLLPVEPEGVTEYVNKGILIDLREKSEQKEEVSIEVPKNSVPDSTFIEVSVVGDLLGPTVKNLDKLVRKPYGCGEQNMVNFVPNIFVLKYLEKTDQLTPAIESKAKKYLEIGYQRELTYKHPDGSYSAFGTSDKGGSTWLTAYVAKSFRQASDYTAIDEQIIKSALEFLAKNQAANGSFPEVGHVIDSQHSSGSDKGVPLTSFVLLAFLENVKMIPEYRNVINKAMDYIVRNTDASDDVYAVAIAAYALHLADHSAKSSFISYLDGRATNDADRKWWSNPIAESEKSNPYYYKPRSVNVEITSYALLAYLEAGLVEESLPILKWLVAQRNENGGFESTQDTVVGLQALVKFATKLTAKDSNVQVIFEFGDGAETRMNVNKDNSIVLQSYEIPPSAKSIKISASGHGTALATVSYKYNVNVTGAWPRFTLDPQVNRISHSDYLHLSVCTTFVPLAGGANQSNMAVMEISLPSGFTVDPDTLPSLEATDRVKRVETKNAETTVVVYFDNLDRNEICPTLDAYKTHKVAKQKPAPVVIYDYYDNARQARQFYSAPKSTLCDICEGDECGTSCAERTAQRQELGIEDSPGTSGSGRMFSSISFLFVLVCGVLLL